MSNVQVYLTVIIIFSTTLINYKYKNRINVAMNALLQTILRSVNLETFTQQYLLTVLRIIENRAYIVSVR